MFVRSLICILLCFTPLLACLPYETTYLPVFPLLNHQQGGTVTWTVSNNHLQAVSNEFRVYIRVTMDHQSLLADTLVLQSSTDPQISQPINLPLRLQGTPGVTLVAAPDAVRIVRWVAGEHSIWIEVKQSSDEWLNINGSLAGPSLENQVFFGLGESARSYDQNNILGENANLPFATRDIRSQEGDFDAAVSVLWCLDLRNSTSFDPGPDYVNCDVIWYSGADQGNGIYGMEGAREQCINWGLDGKIGLASTCDQQLQSLEPAYRLPRQNGMNHLVQEISALQDCTFLQKSESEIFWSVGSYVRVTCLNENNGFDAEASLDFTNDWPGLVVVNPATSFEVNGHTYYGEVDLIYTGQDLVLDHQDLSIAVFPFYPDANNGTLDLQLLTVSSLFPHTEDIEPYNQSGAGLHCSEAELVIAEQTLTLGPAQFRRNTNGYRPIIKPTTVVENRRHTP